MAWPLERQFGRRALRNYVLISSLHVRGIGILATQSNHIIFFYGTLKKRKLQTCNIFKKVNQKKKIKVYKKSVWA